MIEQVMEQMGLILALACLPTVGMFNFLFDWHLNGMMRGSRGYTDMTKYYDSDKFRRLEKEVWSIIRKAEG